jgi:hypothetical protein
LINRPGTDGDPAWLISLEFSGIAPEYDIGKIMDKERAERILVIDPLSAPVLPTASRQARARAVAGQIAARGIRETALMASCTGSALLGDLVRELDHAGVATSAVATIDPVEVTQEIFTFELDIIARRLAAPQYGGLGANCAPGSDLLAKITDLLTMWLERYVEAFITNQEERQLIFDELLARYVSWMGYLVSMFGQVASDWSLPLDVFDDATRMNRAGRRGLSPLEARHCYHTPDKACVSDAQCVADIRRWWARIESKVPMSHG